MESLPKRSDDIYAEIESFEPYELTQCVVYEMAIRNDKGVVIESKGYVRGGNNRIKIFEKSTMNAHIQEYDDGSVHLLETQKLNGYFIDKEISFKRKLNDDETISKQEFKKVVIIAEKNNLELHRSIQSLSNFDDMEKHFNYNNDYSNFQITSKVVDNYKRPRIMTNKLNLKYPMLEIDLNRPTSELIEYITHIKENLEKNQDVLKAPIELLGETLNDAIVQKDYPKKPTAKKMADMFFVYDYVSARQKDIRAYNESIKKKYDGLLLEISKNGELKTKEKQIQKAEVQIEHLKNTIDTINTDIFNEDEVTKPLNLSGGNISKLYYAIKPYIDDLKYKELITGVSTI